MPALGTAAVPIDARILSSSRHDVMDLVRAGTFREDLYYRLNVMTLEVPPLRQRREDIPLLVASFLGQSRAATGKPVKDVSREAMRIVLQYDWPGNVRELENVIERAMVLCQSNQIKISDLPKEFRNNVYNSLHFEGIPEDAKLDETLAMIEKKMIERALKLTDNVQSQAADLLGIGKSGLNWKIKKFKLDIGSKT